MSTNFMPQNTMYATANIYTARSMFPSNGLASAEKRANIPYTYRVALWGKFRSHKQSRVY